MIGKKCEKSALYSHISLNKLSSWKKFCHLKARRACLRFVVSSLSELLQQYIAQRDELERLGREIQDMDKEADELLAQFSVAAEQYGRCAGAA